MSLRPLRGHEEVRRSLARSVRTGTLPPALLVHGPRGVGKQRLALWLGQLLLCEAPDAEGPCGECRGCRMALRLEHPDLHWFFPLPRPKGSLSPDRLGEALEEARAAALEEIRAEPLRPGGGGEGTIGLYLAHVRVLRRSAQRPPSMAPRQVFILGDAELLVSQEASPEAANALLKLLEEPPAETTLVLTSSEPGRLLPTIRSRTAALHLPRLSAEQVRDFLVDEAGREEGESERAAALSQGSIGRALGFLPVGEEPGPLEQLRQEAFHLVRAALAPGRAEVFLTALSHKPAGARGLTELLDFVEEWLRDLGAAAAEAPERILNQDGREWLQRVARERAVDPARAAAALDPVEEARTRAMGNVNPQLLVLGLLRDLRSLLLPPTRRAAAPPRPPAPEPAR